MISFARNFFDLTDGSGSGKTTVQAIAIPMIALGLSSNSLFISKVMKSVCPKKFKSTCEKEALGTQLNLKDFIKVFEKDQISEDLTTHLCDNVIEKRKEMALASRKSERKDQHQQNVKTKNAVFTIGVLDSDS